MPPDMAAAATASLVSFAATSSSASAIPSVNHDSMMKFSHVAMTYQATLLGVIIWDWLTSLPSEIKYIWKAPWKIPKFLYFVARYVCLALVIAVFSLKVVNKPLNQCNAMVRINCIALTVIQATSISVLTQRAYAISEKNRYILLILLSSIATTFAIGIAHAVVGVKAAAGTMGPSGTGSCNIVVLHQYTALTAAFFAIPIAAQTFATIVIVYAAYKNLPAAAALRNLIVVDGILFMVAVDTIGLIQLIFFLKNQIETLGMLNAAALLALTSVFCCRLIIHIRKKGRTLNSIRNTDSALETADWTNYFGAPSFNDLKPRLRRSCPSTRLTRSQESGQTMLKEDLESPSTTEVPTLRKSQEAQRPPGHGPQFQLGFITVHEDVAQVVENMSESEKEWIREHPTPGRPKDDPPTLSISES